MNIRTMFMIVARWCYQWVRPKPSYYHKVNEVGVAPAEEGMPRLIVSLTSFPARIKTVNYTIESLLLQKKKANMVVLWLGYDKFPNKEKDLPKRLLRLTKYGLTIKWCKDIRSYTKLVPSLQEFPNDIIVTVDDDIWYPPYCIERLWASYKKDPNSIHAHRVHEVTVTDGKIDRYVDWETHIYGPKEPSYRWHFTGTGGVLYPPHTLHKDICREDLFLNLAPSVDDIWFWAMAILNNTKCRVVEDSIYTYEGVFIVNNQSLWTDNVFAKNDVALNKIIERYPELETLIKDSCE